MFILHTEVELYMKTIRGMGSSILCITAFSKPNTILMPLDIYILVMLFAQMFYDMITLVLHSYEYRLETRRMLQQQQPQPQVTETPSFFHKHLRRIHISFISVSIAVHIVSLAVVFYYFPLTTYTRTQKDLYYQILLYLYLIMTMVAYLSFVVRIFAYVCEIPLFLARPTRPINDIHAWNHRVREVATLPHPMTDPISSIVLQYNLNQEVLQTSEAPVRMTLSRTVEWLPVVSSTWNALEECCICFDGKSSVALLPCQHQNFCLTCVGHFGDCPLCRIEISGYRVVYHSQSADNSLNSSLATTSDTSTDVSQETSTSLPNTPT